MYYYKYNDQGVRTEKIVDGVVHKYYLQGEKIIAERIGDDLLTFYYDATGVCGFRYYNKGTDGNNSNGTDYYYLKNIFGDILGIYDDSGNVCAEYSYDAWGRCTIKGHASDFARMNPFRYRGYYYDRETGWYYLNSRYYDPEVGGFLSADTVEYLNPAAINGLYTVRDIKRYAEPILSTFMKRGNKYLKAFVVPTAKQSLISAGINTAINIFDYWMQKLYETVRWN